MIILALDSKCVLKDSSKAKNAKNIEQNEYMFFVKKFILQVTSSILN